MQLVAAGCHDGVHLYSVALPEVSTAAWQALMHVDPETASIAAMPITDNGSSSKEGQGPESGVVDVHLLAKACASHDLRMLGVEV